MPDPTYDLVVIGAGPGGYVAALRAAQLGLKTACVEREFLGGTCLNIGCIPSKALLDSSERYYSAKHQFARHGIKVGELSLDMPTLMRRKDEVVKKLTTGVGFLFKKGKVDSLTGHGKIVEKTADGFVIDVAGKRVTTKRILIATGSSPVELPYLKFDGKHILSSTHALSLSEVPKKLIVVGGGYIGVEMGSVWARLGAEVVVIEFLDGILPPSDREAANALQKLLEKQGLKFKFKTGAEKFEIVGGKVKLFLKNQADGTPFTEEADKVLVCVGRKPVTDNLGLAEIGVKVSLKGFVEVDDHFQSNVPGIYAIGDVIGRIMLAHNAEEEGAAAVEIMAGHHGHVNYGACPAVVYTHPELAAVGLTEEQCKARGNYKVGKFPIAANGRAVGMDETDGFVKVLADATTDRVLGVHILAAHASDVIAEATVAMEFAAKSEDLARSYHAHPTLAEALKEAALGVNKRMIHMPNV